MLALSAPVAAAGDMMKTTCESLLEADTKPGKTVRSRMTEFEIKCASSRKWRLIERIQRIYNHSFAYEAYNNAVKNILSPFVYPLL